MDEETTLTLDGATINNNTSDNKNGAGGLAPTPVVPDLAQIINNELSTTSISGEMLPFINIICKVIQSQFDSYFIKLDKINNERNKQIDHMQAKISALEGKITQLETSIDDVDQYERRDTVIISGPSLPTETTSENPSDIIVNTIKRHLHVNMSHSDINVAHRLGQKLQGKNRPIIVKLQNRAKKSELVQACITSRPPLHINESLTPKRRHILSVILKIRSNHRSLFQQCYTSDGKITVKLKNSTTKYTITSEHSLATFLEKHPIFKDAAECTNMI